MEKIDVNDIKIEKITPKHDLTYFKSYEKELVNFLVEDALDNQEKRISTTYLWFVEDKLVSYISLLCDRINLEGSLKIYFRDKGILYKSIPALKIGRLCVDDNYLKRGLGKLMIAFAANKAKDIWAEHAGCRFITLDAKRNPDHKKDVIHFYTKLGFQLLKQRTKGTTPLYLDLLKK